MLGLLGGRITAQFLAFVLDFLDAVPVLCADTHELSLLQASALLFFRRGDVGIRDSSYNVTVSIHRSILYGYPGSACTYHVLYGGGSAAPAVEETRRLDSHGRSLVFPDHLAPYSPSLRDRWCRLLA